MAFTALGESQAVEGDLAGAMATLEEGLTLRQRNPGLSPWPTIYHLLAMARVTTMAGNCPGRSSCWIRRPRRCLGSRTGWTRCMPDWGPPGRRFAVFVTTIRAESLTAP